MNAETSSNLQLVPIARRLVWYESPEYVLANPRLFLVYVMTHGTNVDLLAVTQTFDDEDFRDALKNAPPGVMDVRSWHYWHLVLGITPVPPLPKRHIVCDSA
ncbi:MAG: hypothetical protein M3Y27_31710 [Acidobacteriota bacterium]|nr:hypothetical protein [Acidobacteriota bacterium]